MFDITRYSIVKMRITITFVMMIVILGVMSYVRLPKAEDPGFVVRIARVTTWFPGASPERVEQLVTDKIEKAIQEIPELDYIYSESHPGLSLITVNILDQYANMRPIWDSLRRKVERATRELPDGVIGPIVNDEFGDVFGTIVTISGADFSYKDLKDVADELRNEFLYIDEVSKVDIYGAQEERIFVEYQDAKIAELGSSSIQLRDFLQSRNIINPGGTVTSGDERIILEPSGNFESVDELGNTVIAVPGQDQVVYLKDFTDIQRGYLDPPERIVHSTGRPSLALAISMRDGGNISVMGEKINGVVRRMQEVYPIGMDFDVAIFQPAEVDRKVHEFVINLVQSVILVMFTTLVTIGLRTGLIVASLIPLTILLTFSMMIVFDIGVDQISLAALVISLGMLVDNAIVMAESIMTQLSDGKKSIEAAVDSAKELRIPLLTSSLTTALAFLPIYLAESQAGEYTASIFKVVTIALMASWILSLTVIPMLCVYFLKGRGRLIGKTDSPLFQRYRTLLTFLLRHRTVCLVGFVVVFAFAIASFAWVPKAFFPPSDRAMFTVELDLPVGTKIERTDEVLHDVQAFMETQLKANGEREGVTGWVTFIGGFPPRYILNFNPRPIMPESAFMLVNTSSAGIILDMQEKLVAYALEHHPDLRVVAKSIEYGPPIDAPVEVRISGYDIDTLRQFADQTKQEMSKLEDVYNIRDNWGTSSKKLLVHINQPRALRGGITSRDIAISLQTRLSGFETTKYREDDELIPVILRSVADDRDDLDRLESLNVYSQLSNVSLPLKQVADLELVWQPSKIVRRNRLRTITVRANIRPNYTANAAAVAMTPWLNEQEASWPYGYHYEFGGEIETSAKSQDSIFDKVPLAGLFIVLLLIVQFDSFRRPLIIILTIPLGLIGVAVGLLATGAQLGFMVLLGIVSLSGIVVNNAIVLLDRITSERAAGKDPWDAILDAAIKRLRPILLTTVTTIGGLMPLWVGGGELFKPMAITIIFGLFFATALTLGLIPVLYAVFYRVENK